MTKIRKTRRQFLTGAAAVGEGLTILPSGTRAGVNAPSNKLNRDLHAFLSKDYREGWPIDA